MPAHTSQLDTVLEISSFVLTTLKAAASVSTIPFLKESAGLALGIVDSVQQAKGNKESFKRLAEDSCRLIYSVVIIYAEREKEGGQLPEDLNNDIGGLVTTLTSIDKFTRKLASRNFFLRIIFAKGDVGRVQEYRERMRQSLDVFWLQSSIRVRDNLSQISKQQGEMYQVLTADGKDSRPLTGQQGRLEVLSATQYKGDIINNTRGDTFEVAGNQVNNTGSHNNTQMTTKTVQSVTSGAGGDGGSGHYGGSGGAGGNISFSL